MKKFQTRALSLLLALAMVAALLPAGVLAAEPADQTPVAESQPQESIQPDVTVESEPEQEPEQSATGSEQEEPSEQAAEDTQKEPSAEAQGQLQAETPVAAAAKNGSEDGEAVAQVGDQTYSSLAEAVEKAEPGQTVTLLVSTTISQPLVLNKALTLTAAEGTVLTYSGTGTDAALSVETDDPVVIKGLQLNSATHGVDLVTNSTHVTLQDCLMYVKDRGISYVQDGLSENGALVLDNTQIRSTRVSDYETQTAIGDFRGISIYDVKNTEVTLKNGSELSGFGYCINVTGKADEVGVADTSGLKVTVEDSQLRGWTGMNIWGSYASYTITNSRVLGINTSTGSSNSFAALVFNRDLYNQFAGRKALDNTLTIADSTITNYQPEGLLTTESLLRIDSGVKTLTFAGEVQFIDTTGKEKAALYLGGMLDPTSFEKENVVYADGANVTCQTTVNGEAQEMPLAPAYVLKNTYGDGSVSYGEDFSDFVGGVDYAGAADSKETIILLQDIDESDFAVNSEAGHGNRYGGWTLDLNGHTLKVQAWDADKVTVVDSVGGGDLLAGGESVLMAANGTRRYTTSDSFDAALEQAQKGDTITLWQDVTMSKKATIDQTLTIDGQGHAIRGAADDLSVYFEITGGTTTFQNVTLEQFGNQKPTNGRNAVVMIPDSLAADTDAKVVADQVTMRQFCRTGFDIRSGSFEIKNSTIDCTNDLEGNRKLTKAVLAGFGANAVTGSITDTVIENANSTYDEWTSAGVEIYNNATVSISGGSISGCGNGVYVDNYWAGGESYPDLPQADVNVSISGTQISANDNAVQIYSREGQTRKAAVTISSGYFTGNLNIVDATGNETMTITGGSFSVDPTAYVPEEGYQVIGSGPYVVQVQAPFEDVAEGAWYEDSVAYVSGAGLMVGTSEDNFSPTMEANRAMMAAILYRMAGSPAVNGENPFADVPDGTWYTDAVIWAAENGIVAGYDANTFGPTRGITREQMAAMFYRFAKYMGYDTSASADLSAFEDADQISNYAKTAMSWANAEGLIVGMSADRLAPKATTQRAQMAAMIMRFCQKFEG